jgi:hypothetical protein
VRLRIKDYGIRRQEGGGYWKQNFIAYSVHIPRNRDLTYTSELTEEFTMELTMHTNSVVSVRKANYTDRATAACRRSQCPL